MKSDIRIAILNYPDSLQSAIYGLSEMFLLSNRLIDQYLGQKSNQ